MSIRIAINGLGRIGRTIVRALFEDNHHPEIQLVAINELAAANQVEHLLKYDSSHGKFRGNISSDDGAIIINKQRIRLTHERDPSRLPWAELNIDVVLECTGAFSTRAELQPHIDAGAKRVLLSQPGAPDVDFTAIFGINHQFLKAEHTIISNGSCTTNCVVPLIDVIDKKFGVESGTITTIHASMNDQKVIDAYHEDLRRSRAASHSIIPVDTKLALGIERILPHLESRFEAIAVRVPTINVTAMDVSLTVNNNVSKEDVNSALKNAAANNMKGIIRFTEEPLVSVDFIHDAHSCIVDALLTRVSHKRLIKCLVWCDNEWGFANRMLDMAMIVHHSK